MCFNMEPFGLLIGLLLYLCLGATQDIGNVAIHVDSVLTWQLNIDHFPLQLVVANTLMKFNQHQWLSHSANNRLILAVQFWYCVVKYQVHWELISQSSGTIPFSSYPATKKVTLRTPSLILIRPINSTVLMWNGQLWLAEQGCGLNWELTSLITKGKKTDIFGAA